MRQNSAIALMPQRGADEVEQDAGPARYLCCTHQMIRAQKANSQGTNSLKKPNNSSVQQKSANNFQLHQPASFLFEGELAGFIHVIQTIQFNILARYPITTTVQP
jgi:hypothetical protein